MNTEKRTSVHMQACKTASSEIHNQRRKTLGYVREDLTHLNSSKVIETVHDCEERIRATYQSVVGQKMQPSATPIQYYLHFDEGHFEARTREWKPNLHGHVIFDTTCREHVTVRRQVKRNGKVQKGPDGKPLMREVDNYGKIIRLTPADMSLMQDLAAEATGLRRGVPGDAVHIDAQRYKALAVAEQSRSLEQENAGLAKTNAELAQESSALRQEVSGRRMELKAMDVVGAAGEAMKAGFGRLSAAIGLSPEVRTLKEKVASQERSLEEKSAEIGRLEASLQEETQTRKRLQVESNRSLFRAEEAEKRSRERGAALSKVAYCLAGLGGAIVALLEKAGMPELLGRRLWEQARRETVGHVQDGDRSRGVRM